MSFTQFGHDTLPMGSDVGRPRIVIAGDSSDLITSMIGLI